MLTNSVGFHLFNRVVTEQKQLDADGPATRVLLTLLEGKDPRGTSFWDLQEQGGVRDLDDSEAERLLYRVALEGIRKDPWGFLLFTPSLAWHMLLAPAAWIPVWGETVAVHPRLETPPPLAVTAASLAWRWTLEEIHGSLWPFLCWAAVAGTCLGLFLPQRNLILALAWIPAGYLLSSACVEYFSPRYNSAIVPFVAALAMVPLGLLLTVCNRWVQRSVA